MGTELIEKNKFGFTIDQAEMVRIKDSVNEQIKKVNSGVNADLDISVKYRNGVIHDSLDLSELFAGENGGSSEIIQITLTANNTNKDSSIMMKLSNITNEQIEEDDSVIFKINSIDKDWTFISLSVLKERVEKFRSNKIADLFFNKDNIRLLIPLFMLAPLLYFLLYADINSGDEVRAMKKIYSENADARSYMHQINLMKQKNISSSTGIFSPLIVLVMCSMLLLMFGEKIASFYPRFVFLWGDSEIKYKNRKSVINFIGIVIFIGVVVGVFGNYIYDIIK